MHFSRVLIRLLVLLSRYSANHIALNSQASLKVWIDSGGRKRRVSVIYPGTYEYQISAQLQDTRRIALYRELYSAEGKPLIGMFGRISRWKGQEVFLRALDQLPGVNAVIVGAALFAEDDYERRIKALARELDLEDRVRFVGHVEDAMTLMAACDVVAHCSTAPEPFGLVIAEAMLIGTPVIASDAGGAREIVTQNVTGQLTPLKDHEALAAAIRRYLDDPQWSRQLAQRAQAWAQEKFSGVAMTAGFLQVIETL
jgi:glycosyltransferase involved in cell wall biosynthesis